ncbi:MAG: hypothetical protein WAT71_09750 [Ignavibacteria bacterium]
MKSIIIFVILILTLLVITTTYSQVKNCDISYFDSNQVRKNFKKVTFEKVTSDSLAITVLGNVQKIYLKDIIKVGYMSETKPAQGILTGAIVGGGVILIAALLLSTSSSSENSDGYVDFSLTFGEVVVGTLAGALVGGLVGGAISGFSVKKKYKTVDLTKLSLNESYEEINKILKTNGVKKK